MSATLYSSGSEVYDKIFSTKDYELESSQILQLLDLPGRHSSVLDVGCGTGGHATFISRKAVYTGVDVNQNMIQCAVEKNIENATFLCSNVSDLEKTQYDSAVALFNIPNHVHEISCLISFFESIYEKTSPSADLIFDVWNGAAAISSPPRKEIRTAQNYSLTLLPIFNTFNQAVEIEYHYHDSRSGALIWRDSLKMTVWTPKTIIDCLDMSGYRVDKIYSEFGRKQRLETAKESDYKLLFHCKKKSRRFS